MGGGGGHGRCRQVSMGEWGKNGVVEAVGGGGRGRVGGAGGGEYPCNFNKGDATCCLHVLHTSLMQAMPGMDFVAKSLMGSEEWAGDGSVREGAEVWKQG